jgi:hypothetical protein
MSRIINHAISAGLIGTGALAWTFAGRPLVKDRELEAPLNPLGINGSPYGEVFAMAMQGPIDIYFHGATNHDHNDAEHADHEEGEHDEVAESDHNHDHEHEGCTACREVKLAATAPAGSLSGRFQNLLTSLEKASTRRTNPKSANSAQKRFLRRKVEDKLRFAYQLDPAHYANYNSLHLFLTEPQLGTRPELTPSAAKLAEQTIQYCLKQDSDPRPALTAAAAATNILELMFNDQLNPTPKFNTVQMRQYLALLDHCISRYLAISAEWDRSKNWELLSPMRVTECKDRFVFISKLRESAEIAILRIEKKSNSPQASN